MDNDFGDDLEDNYEDDFDDDDNDAKNKTNKVGGVAAAGKAKDLHQDSDEEEDDIFENSRTKENKPVKNPQEVQEKPVAEKQAELKQEGKLQPTDNDDEEEEDGDPEEQAKQINDQFQYLYDSDPQLREVLGSDLASLSLEEKYQIMTAYIHGGGVRGLVSEEEATEGLSAEDAKVVEEEFQNIYEADP